MRRIGRYVLVPALLAAMVGGPLLAPATVALADDSATLKARLDEARATRDGLYAEAGKVSEELNETRYQLQETQKGIDETNTKIDSTKADIQVKEQELTERRGELADQVAEDYKSGGLRLLDLILSSRSIEEFVSHIYYADKVSEQRADTIHATVRLQDQLEEQKGQLETQQQALETQQAEQQELATQQEAQQADLQSKAQAADDYVAGLDQELKDALAAEEAARKAEAERAAREAAARLAAQQAEQLQQQQQQSQQPSAPSTGGGSSSSSSGGSSSGGSSSSSSSGGSSYSEGPSGDYGTGSLTQSQRDIIVNAALSMVGGNYIYGAYDPASRTFDCSGLTSYCYAQAGIYLPHSSASQRSMCSIKPISALQPGDLVFWYGHVAIYYGDGMIIEACDPGTGIVGPRAIWGSPIGGGTP